MKTLFNLCIFIALCAGGLFLWKHFKGDGNAKLSGFSIGGQVLGYPKVWLTIEFRNIPEGIDPTKVKVVFTSETLTEGSQEFDWNFLCSHAQVGKPNGIGRVPAEGLASDQPPKLNYPIDVQFPLKFKEKIQVEGHVHFFTVYAELFWDGHKQDSTQTGVDHFYHTESR